MGQSQSWIWINKWHIFSVGSAKTCNFYKVETLISNYSDTGEKNLGQNHRVIKEARTLSTDKLSCKEIYSILISNIIKKPTSNIYFEKLLENAT